MSQLRVHVHPGYLAVAEGVGQMRLINRSDESFLVVSLCMVDSSLETCS
jgi:hypothetical protein